MLVFLCSFQSTSDTNLNLGKENLQIDRYQNEECQGL